jgi:arylsulfatase A-like enzyme
MTRRTFHSMLGAMAARPLAAAAPRRPNIVLMMADDMGFSDLGCYGSEIATPNLDGLAKSGIRFTQFYNTARCCPTRASLLTGLHPHQAGIGHMVADRGLAPYQGYLNDRCVTIAEALREAGYTTLMSGKWHVGEEKPHWPKDRGFDRYFGLFAGSSSYYRVTEARPLVVEDQVWRPKDDTFYLTDLFTDRALQFLEENGRGPKPFFLYTAFTSPHWPLHALPEDIARYRGKYKIGWDEVRKRRHARQIEMGLLDRRWPITPRDPDVPAWTGVKDVDDQDLRMAVYAAQVDRMDQNIGRILKKLQEIGQADNTLILFLSDNGACAEPLERGKPGVPPGGPDSYTSYGVGWANASNTPFRLYKHWMHEGGISTPLIAHWPGVIRQGGTVTNQPGHLVDIMATCVDVAGGSYPKTYRGRPVTPLEGRSLRPVFEGKRRAGHPHICWEHEGNRAVRQGDWKLVSARPWSAGWELYNMAGDRTELNNLAAKHPERVRAMEKLYEAWAKRCGIVPYDSLPKPGGPGIAAKPGVKL